MPTTTPGPDCVLPGYVMECMFIVRNVRQDTPFTGQSNLLHFELAANVNISSGENVTIFGLTGSNCDASPGQTLVTLGSSTSSTYGQTALWNCNKGELITLWQIVPGMWWRRTSRIAAPRRHKPKP